MIVEILLGIIALALIGVIAAIGWLVRVLWLTMGSMECLCNNVGGLRQQMAAGQHQHG